MHMFGGVSLISMLFKHDYFLVWMGSYGRIFLDL